MVKNMILSLFHTGEQLLLNETDGSLLIKDSTDIFPFSTHDFSNYPFSEKSHPTEAMVIEMYTLEEDKNLAQIFSYFDRNFEFLYLTQHQIVAFCKKYHRYLRDSGHQTFFLLKGGEEFCVANAYFYGEHKNLLGIGVSDIGRSSVWYNRSKHRIVVPKINS